MIKLLIACRRYKIDTFYYHDTAYNYLHYLLMILKLLLSFKSSVLNTLF